MFRCHFADTQWVESWLSGATWPICGCLWAVVKCLDIVWDWEWIHFIPNPGRRAAQVYSCMGKPGALPSSDTSLSLFLHVRNQGVCWHKRCQVVAEPLRSVYTRIKKGCPWLKTFSANSLWILFTNKRSTQSMLLIATVMLENKHENVAVMLVKCWKYLWFCHHWSLCFRKTSKHFNQEYTIEWNKAGLWMHSTNMQLPNPSVSNVFACSRRFSLTIIKRYGNLQILCNRMRRKSKYFSRAELPKGSGVIYSLPVDWCGSIWCFAKWLKAWCPTLVRLPGLAMNSTHVVWETWWRWLLRSKGQTDI